MPLSVPPPRWIDDTRVAIDAVIKTSAFITEHRVWEGFFKYKWVLKGLVWMTVILLLLSFSSLYEWLSSGDGLLSGLHLSSFFTFEWLTGLMGNWGNFVILIASEVIIFHFTRRTMMIVTGKEIDTSWLTFVAAEKRMIRIAIAAFFFEIGVKAAVSAIIGIAGYDYLEVPANYLIHSYYLGFAILDNYNELFGMNFKQSHRYTFHYMPVALIVGGILAVILNIPVLGAIVGPVICAVIGTLAMYTVQQRDNNMAWIFVEYEKKPKRKHDKKRKSRPHS